MSAAVYVNGTAYTAPTKGDTAYAASFSSLIQALCAAASSVFQFGGASGLSAGNARYMQPGMAAVSSTETFVVVPIGGKLSRLYLYATSAMSGDSCVFVLQVNGVASALTATMLNAQNSVSDVTHSVSVVAGDRISLKATAGASYSSGGANLSASVLFTPS